MTKPWKHKVGANTKVGVRLECNCTTCPAWNIYKACTIGKNFRTCEDYHVRKEDNLILKG